MAIVGRIADPAPLHFGFTARHGWPRPVADGGNEVGGRPLRMPFEQAGGKGCNAWNGVA